MRTRMTRKDWMRRTKRGLMMRRMRKMRMKSLMKTKRTRSLTTTPVCVTIYQLYEIVKNLQKKYFFIDAVRIVCESGSV